MLPPIDQSILQDNPKFAALHAKLSAEVLNPNGSTKNHPVQKQRDGVSAALNTARIEAAKSKILIISLSSLDLSPPTPTTITTNPRTRTSQQPPQQKALPPEVLELIILLTAQLSLPSLSKSSTTLLESTTQYQSLQTHLPIIANLLSTHLHTTTLTLSRILTPQTNPSFLHRQLPHLLPSVQALQSSILSQRQSIALSRQTLTQTAVSLLHQYHLAHVLCIQILELQKHGPLLRHSITKISQLSLQAQSLSLELRERYLRGEKLIYDERTKEALGNYMRELSFGRERLKEREKALRRKLWGYGVGRDDDGAKERVMREIARVYGELKSEIREVGGDVQKLRG